MAIGELMPVFSGMTKTFEDDFTAGLTKWPNTEYPWARQTVINGEQQYYSDQVGLLASDETIFINGSNNLVLRAKATPSYYRNTAKVVLNGYVIKSQPSANQILVVGENYYNRDLFSNSMGIGWNREAQGFIKIGGNPEQQYISIQDTVTGSTYSEHLITLASAAPSGISFNNPDYRANVFRRQPYISGMVTTQNRASNGNSGFSQKFGRWGARIKSPKGQFCFPAFWLWRDYEELGITFTEIQKGPEFDIWEILGHAPDISYHTLHSPGFDMRPNGQPLEGVYQGVEQWKTSHMQQFQRIGGRDFSAGFYWVYFDWFTDNTCAWYIETAPNSGQMIEVANAKIQSTAIDGTIDEAMMIFNNAYGSDWSWNQSKQIDNNYAGFVGPTNPPWDFEISEVCVEQFDGVQTSLVSTQPTVKRYTDQTVVGPEGTIEDVVIGLPTHETDRQGKVHEVEAKITYRPINILPEQIGLEWEVIAPAPLVPVFADGNDKSWRVRIHLTTTDTTPLPEALDCEVRIKRVYLK